MIPKPFKTRNEDGFFAINNHTRIIVPQDPEIQEIGKLLSEKIAVSSGLNLSVENQLDSKKDNTINLIIKDTDEELGPEGYRISISPIAIYIKAWKLAGLFYSMQAFRQLFPPQFESTEIVHGMNWKLPCLYIKDLPRFPWRGMHLDVCRHFFPKAVIKKYIDMMAFYKMNTFHWHLTDDQGWRIEIKKYPKLTKIGAWRVDRSGQNWNDRKPPKENEKPTYGGFYTQEDIKEIVAYAKSKYITIVPEIEMPGHAIAALAAYPELSCTGGPFHVMPGGYWPIRDIFCAGNEKTFEFLENVLSEVIELFPGEFIHVGGDEAHKENWAECKKCQKRIKEEGLKDEKELQSYFIKRIEKFLNAHDKRLIGWDEIFEGGIAENAAVMSWRGMAGGIAAAKTGHDVVMSPAPFCYFDYYQGKHGEPPAIGGYLPLDKVYSFEPIPKGIPGNKKEHILGAQGSMWTEHISTPEHLEYMLLPRMAAMAEVVWTDKKHRNFDNFKKRMMDHYDRFALMNINYYISPPQNFGGREVVFRKTKIELQNGVENSAILFTDDGTEPTIESEKYLKPILVNRHMTLTARTILQNGRMSHPVSTYYFLVDHVLNGLHYKYFEGDWEHLPEFDSLEPKKTGHIFDFELDKIEAEVDNFGVEFTGTIKIIEEGKYTFYLISENGHKLEIEDLQNSGKFKTVVDTDSKQKKIKQSGSISLQEGKNQIKVSYFQKSGGQHFKVLYKGPGVEKQPIPPQYLYIPLDPDSQDE